MTLSSFVLLAAVGRVSKANSLGFFLLARGKDAYETIKHFLGGVVL